MTYSCDEIQTVPVLLYHSVADEPESDPRFAVSPATFREHMEVIEASGRTTLQITELAVALADRRPFSEAVMAITFDDGYADTYEAANELSDRGLQCSIYITTGEVRARDRLTCSQVAELAGMRTVELGAHAVHHQHLDELDEHELAEEVRPSKLQLEDITQMSVTSFAYPHGAYDKQARQAVIDAGFSSAAAVKNAVSHLADDRFAIARWTVRADTSPARIAQILAGDHVPQAWSRERMRTRAYRAFRRGRRRFATRAAQS